MRTNEDGRRSGSEEIEENRSDVRPVAEPRYGYLRHHHLVRSPIGSLSFDSRFC